VIAAPQPVIAAPRPSLASIPPGAAPPESSPAQDCGHGHRRDKPPPASQATSPDALRSRHHSLPPAPEVSAGAGLPTGPADAPPSPTHLLHSHYKREKEAAEPGGAFSGGHGTFPSSSLHSLSKPSWTAPTGACTGNLKRVNTET